MMQVSYTMGIVSIILCLTACSLSRSFTTEENNKDLVRKMNAEVWNKGNLKAIDTYFSVDFVQHFLPNGNKRKGREALREHIMAHRNAFPDWQEEIIHMVAENDLIVLHFKSSGTNLGTWIGKPPTGNKVDINEFSILRIKDGQIAEQWLMPDLYNLMSQVYKEKE